MRELFISKHNIMEKHAKPVMGTKVQDWLDLNADSQQVCCLP